jgi:hypothetical protein
MTLEYLNKQKELYKHKQNYFKNVEFNVLAEDFQRIVDLIGEMENYVKEKENGKV